MGVEVGFEFYRLVNNNLVPANVVEDRFLNNKSLCNNLLICGRCEATNIFIDAVNSFDPHHGCSELKPEEKYSPYLLLNHKELDGFEDHRGEEKWNGWFRKYFYCSLDDFKNRFDFDEAQKEHDNWLKRLNEDINDYEKEIESIRYHQENAKTKIAFEGFQKRINKLNDEIKQTRLTIKDVEEDDYDYNHYMWIKEYIEIVKEKIKTDENLIVIAFASY